VAQAAERPLFGYGFNSFWGMGAASPALREGNGFITSILQAHNGFLDVRLETGYVGLVVLAVVLVTALAQAGRRAESQPALGWLCMTLIVTAILHNAMESSFFRGFNLMWIAFLLAVSISGPRHGLAPVIHRRPTLDQPTRAPIPDCSQ
jgi:O-antigen ligase